MGLGKRERKETLSQGGVKTQIHVPLGHKGSRMREKQRSKKTSQDQITKIKHKIKRYIHERNDSKKNLYCTQIGAVGMTANASDRP